MSNCTGTEGACVRCGSQIPLSRARFGRGGRNWRGSIYRLIWTRGRSPLQQPGSNDHAERASVSVYIHRDSSICAVQAEHAKTRRDERLRRRPREDGVFPDSGPRGEKERRSAKLHTHSILSPVDPQMCICFFLTVAFNAIVQIERLEASMERELLHKEPLSLSQIRVRDVVPNANLAFRVKFFLFSRGE